MGCSVGLGRNLEGNWIVYLESRLGFPVAAVLVHCRRRLVPCRRPVKDRFGVEPLDIFRLYLPRIDRRTFQVSSHLSYNNIYIFKGGKVVSHFGLVYNPLISKDNVKREA